MARDYLIYEDVRKDSSLKTLFDACASAILNGNARVEETFAPAGYAPYPCFIVEGKEILTYSMLEYYLFTLMKSGFDYEKARDFSEKMLKLCGWHGLIGYVLEKWVERNIRNPYFYNSNTTGVVNFDKWELKPGEPRKPVREDYIKFACYVAVSCVKHGASYDAVSAKQIFGWVTDLGSDLPEKLKKYGSGDLPKDVTEYKDDAVSCKANDVFATVKITLKDESEQAYQKVLDFLCRLLEAGFPKSYSIDFRNPEKSRIPINGLPKNGVCQLFANASCLPGLHERIERYARLAMREDEWYNNLENEPCAMPGTFAVFALGLSDEKYHTLVCDYLKLCDGEHQIIHGKFVLAYIEKYGFSEKGMELYDLCEKNIQHMPKKLTALRKSEIN